MGFSRLIRQIIIGTVYIVLFSMICFALYRSFIWVAPTCSDGKQNQNEGGIDCGGKCSKQCEPPLNAKQIVSQEVAFVPAGHGSYDLLAKIYNPNDIAGASSFVYTLSLRDANGAVLVEKSGTSFILPQESKYLFEFQLASARVPVSATFLVTNVKWERLKGYSERPRIVVTRQAYDRISSGPGYGAATGLVVNSSPYDFRSIGVKVVLRDASGKPLAINATEMNTMQAKEQRDFRLVWPSAFPGQVASYEMFVDADVYHSANFLKQYAPTTAF